MRGGGVHAELGQVVNGAEPGGLGDRRRAGFVLVRQRGVGRAAHPDIGDHLAATEERRRASSSSLAPQDTDAGWPASCLERDEISTQRRDVDGRLRNRLQRHRRPTTRQPHARAA